MLNLNNASRSVGPDEKRNGLMKSKPLREHELLGLPKSTGKPERPRLGPVRMKDLFGSPESKKTTVSARRMTTMSVTTSNTSKKLYHGRDTLVVTPATNAYAYNKTSELSHIQGLSKSDGKINKTQGLGHERLKSETMKNMLEAWEASQTVQPSARKSRPAETRSQNVRRKLYSVFHSSPITMPKSNRKSVAQKLPKSQKTEITASKMVKPDVRKSIKPQVVSRKSCLPPPNSIRDKYINTNLRQNETIREESTLSITNENESRILESGNIDEATETLKITEKIVVETKNSEEFGEKKISEGFSRPTVIVGRSTKKDKQKEKNDDFDDFVPLPISRPPLQELDENTSSLRTKLNSFNTSLPEDRFDNNSRRVRGESFYYENLPRNSFLETTIPTKSSLVKMDLQTLSWIHGNLKLNIQTIEEQLFTMKLVLKTIEDTMKSHHNVEDQQTTSNVENGSTLPSAPFAEAKINGESEAEVVPESEINEKIVNVMPEIPFVPEERKNGDSMNNPESSIVESLADENKENVGESSRRRSARLAEKLSKTPKNRDDSFSQIEHELNIVHANKKKNNTPVRLKSGKKIDPRSRKSIREYMALKSSINFLATPDVKGFATPMGEKDTPLHRRITRRSLSRKLLTELDELYADSPS